MTLPSLNYVIDIADWPIDPEYAPYPEGSRAKHVVVCPDPAPYNFLIPGHRYLYKQSNPNFPAQFWGEVIAYVVGQYMGVPVPPAYVAVDSSKIDGGAAVLIEWFYGPKFDYAAPIREKESKFFQFAYNIMYEKVDGNASDAVRYIPGSHYMLRTIKNYDLKTGRQHNIHSLMAVSLLLEKGWGLIHGWDHWVKVFSFDALIGNTDRHQDNWGVIWYADNEGKRIAQFAPAFDNGTALGHEILDENIHKFSSEERLMRYVCKGMHHIRWKADSPNRLGHIELVKALSSSNVRARKCIESSLSFNVCELVNDINKLCDLSVSAPLTKDRFLFVMRLISLRLKEIQAAIG